MSPNVRYWIEYTVIFCLRLATTWLNHACVILFLLKQKTSALVKLTKWYAHMYHYAPIQIIKAWVYFSWFIGNGSKWRTNESCEPLYRFQQRPFLKVSERSYKLKFHLVTLFDVNHCACDLLNCRTTCWLCVHLELTRKLSHGSTKQIK